MTLRLRITLLAAGAVALAIALAAGAMFLIARREVRAEIDAFLVERARPLRVEAGDFRRGFSGPTPLRQRGVDLTYVGADSVFQVITADGTVVFVSDPDVTLPVDQIDQEIAGGRREQTLRDARVDGEHFRMITTGVAQGTAVQIGRSLAEADAILRGLGARLVLIGAVGVALAGLSGWLVARRALVPVGELTAAAERIAQTQDLTTPIEVGSEDEVGRLAASFNTMLEALEVSRRQQRRLVEDASHELRTPLTALRTNLEVLQRNPAMSEDDRRQLLDDVTLELRELGDLVAELVELATDRPIAEEPVQEVRLDLLVQQVAERARRRTGRNIVVEAEAIVAEGRPAMLERAVLNLLDNADKWSPTTAPIEVVVGDGRITVRDQGAGIDDRDLPHIFDRFYRSDAARSMPGSGLGLSIVKQVAELHGGDVFAESAPGGGAVVGMSIPGSQPILRSDSHGA